MNEIETDRYQRVKIDASERFCKQPKCTNNDVSTAVKTFEDGCQGTFLWLYQITVYNLTMGTQIHISWYSS